MTTQIKLISTDDDDFRLVNAVLLHHSKLVQNLVGDTQCDGNAFEIPLPHHVLLTTINTMCNYLNEYQEKPIPTLDENRMYPMGSFDYEEKMLGDLSMEDLQRLAILVNFLDIQPMVDHIARLMAVQLKGMSVEEMRQVLNIESDFTPEEEDEARRFLEEYKEEAQ
jgi:S-phase kinase-associated protein 1